MLLHRRLEERVISPVKPVPAPRTRPPVHLPIPIRPVPAPRTRPEERVISPVKPVLAPRTRPPVHLPSPIRPVPAPQTRPEERVISPVKPVPAPRTRPPVRLPSPIRPVPAPHTRPEERVISPVLPVPAPRTRPPVPLPSPIRPVPAPHTRPEERVISPVKPVLAPRTRPPLRYVLHVRFTYSAKKYSLVLEEKNWTEAQEYCRQHYTNLSIIHTEEDWKAIQSSLGNFIGDVWIGLHRPGSTEKWKWSDGEDFMFFNWENGFGVHAVGHDCVLSISSHWQPVSCATQRQYMCQREVHRGNGTTEKVYELMPGTKMQQDALKDCKSKSRGLASILNQKEQEAFDEVTEGDTWIGLEHNNSNTLWEWSNGEPFQQWENTRVDGNCVQLNRKWRPKDCSRQSAFLCYGDEHPLNNTGDLNTPVTPETTSPTSTGPPSTEMFTTTPTTSPTTTTNGQSTTSPTTTTNGQSTTSPTTTTIHHLTNYH
ncbi:putative C-type lectin domain family 20 member A [Oncorhynchus kisutch]|uniref:putative C-type lectin domain family 20 member A n=1 Tax=Oncorhynchus kisutch TaxID=8019 RepID=UPI0012DDA4D9|nr:putative C-type lectin domain family 20 member A [Oncorhynchus kisutch]